MLVLLAILLSSFYLSVLALIEAPDGSVCFNNCNGHGSCIDYSCHCFLGYHGDDCTTTYVPDGQKIIPILSAGHYNVTRKNFTSAVTRNKFILVGFSSYDCHRCIVTESEYEKVADRFLELKIPFARANVDEMKSIALEHSATEVPSLVFFQKHRPYHYNGQHYADAIVAYASKLTGKPAKSLSSVADVEAFLKSRGSPEYSLSTVMVVGFFSDHDGIEEDDYDDWLQVASDLQHKEDIYFGVVTNPKTSDWFKKNKTIDRTPSMMLVGEDETPHVINLDELFGHGEGVEQWITNNAAPLVGKLTHLNFRIYEKMMKPMLMLFMDLTNEHQTNDPKIVGGRSGGILNEVLIDEFRQVAKEHSDRIIFVYLDGVIHADKMRALGLYGGAERLPSLAFNTRDNIQAPFPEELSINKDTILQFCADFISGKLRSVQDSHDMAKRALMASVPINPRNKAVRKAKKEAPEQVRGVSEQFGDGTKGDQAVTRVTNVNFDEVVMNEEKDVVLMLHSKGCESCSHFAVYFKKMAERFKDLGLYSLVIARMDVTDESPPAYLNLMEGQLPLMVMLPAFTKYPPWNFYSGVGKVQPMMKWVHELAKVPFDLPNLPHLTPKEREMYKTQIREREEELDKKRREEAREMAKEERAQKELERKRRKELKKEQEQEQQLGIQPGSDASDQATTQSSSSSSSSHTQQQQQQRTQRRKTRQRSEDDDDDEQEDHDEF